MGEGVMLCFLFSCEKHEGFLLLFNKTVEGTVNFIVVAQESTMNEDDRYV
jgi:hypothetical protein